MGAWLTPSAVAAGLGVTMARAAAVAGESSEPVVVFDAMRLRK